jgi:hypothetical protein
VCKFVKEMNEVREPLTTTIADASRSVAHHNAPIIFDNPQSSPCLRHDLVVCASHALGEK